MIIALPHKTLKRYCRDFRRERLRKFLPLFCPVCQATFTYLETRKRKILDIFVMRGCCAGRKIHYFTFLPLFVAPAKWFGYKQIQKALIFVHRSKFSSLHRGLIAWENRRGDRIDDGKPGGPSSSTVRRWANELGQRKPKRPWLYRAKQALKMKRKPNPPRRADSPPAHPRENIRPREKTNHRSAKELLIALLGLGRLLLGRNSSPGIPVLSLGLWWLECRYGQRCLARFELAGRVVPIYTPDLIVTGLRQRGYPPFS